MLQIGPLGEYHPMLVHFVVALAILGVILRRRSPAHAEVQLLAAESQLVDRKDAVAAVATLGRIQIPADQPRLRLRHGLLLADALIANGQKDAARAMLQPLRSQFPNDQRLKKKLEDLGGS